MQAFMPAVWVFVLLGVLTYMVGQSCFIGLGMDRDPTRNEEMQMKRVENDFINSDGAELVRVALVIFLGCSGRCILSPFGPHGDALPEG